MTPGGLEVSGAFMEGGMGREDGVESEARPEPVVGRGAGRETGGAPGVMSGPDPVVGRAGGRGGIEGGFEIAAEGEPFLGGPSEIMGRAGNFFFAFGAGGGELAAMRSCYLRSRRLCVPRQVCRIRLGSAFLDDHPTESISASVCRKRR
jgi:hypothetical protein